MNAFSLNTKTFIMVNILICFFFSCFFVTLHFAADGDVANTPTTWNEVSKYGILALKYWGRTTDSWYLSVYPIHYIVFYLFGSSTTIIKFLEIVQIFSLSITIAFICYNETKNKFSFLLAPILSSLSSLSSFAFSVGYIAHPASHNITNLYGVFCVLLFIFNTKKTINVKDVLTCFLSIIAAVSDPWFLPSYYLPLLISITYKAFYKKEKDILSVALMIFTGILLFSHVIEKVLGIPVASFSLGPLQQWFNNIYWLMYGIGGMVNIFFINNPKTYILSASIFLLLTFYTIYKSHVISSLKIFITLSLLGIMLSFIIGSTEGAEKHARFFVNIIYLGISIIFIAAIKSKKIISVFFVAILFLSQLYSHTQEPRKLLPWSANQLYTFVKENNLTYGYGPYWGTQALAVSWISGWHNIIRPVMFDKKNGSIIFSGRAQTFTYWYNNSHKGRTFIAIMKDVEECHDLDRCLIGVKHQLGDPDEILTHKDMTFYIYNNGISIK